MVLLGLRTYNKHISVMRTFTNWGIRVKNYPSINAFNHIELRTENKGDATIIAKEEFENLLSVITPKNGMCKGRDKNRHYYHPWLRTAFQLALETGLRREEFFGLRWSDIIEMQKGVLIIRVMKLKVNRIASGDGNGKSIKYVPVTKSLMQLLSNLNYADKKETSGYIIERSDELGMTYLKNILSRSFAHYIKQATDRNIEFKDLRKTYITHLTFALGPNAKLFTGHINDQVLKNHYLSNAFIT